MQKRTPNQIFIKDTELIVLFSIFSKRPTSPGETESGILLFKEHHQQVPTWTIVRTLWPEDIISLLVPKRQGDPTGAADRGQGE